MCQLTRKIGFWTNRLLHLVDDKCIFSTGERICNCRSVKYKRKNDASPPSTQWRPSSTLTLINPCLEKFYTKVVNVQVVFNPHIMLKVSFIKFFRGSSNCVDLIAALLVPGLLSSPHMIKSGACLLTGPHENWEIAENKYCYATWIIRKICFVNFFHHLQF